ncbi:RHS domain-containing protein [Delftia acidovorans]|uniref:RHS domain-containing protein n=1 Tax=Delftia acidovorans TaxID=80866 RepID=UPI0036F2F3BF
MPPANIQDAGEEPSTYWCQCDQIGTPLELADAQGKVAWAADYKVAALEQRRCAHRSVCRGPHPRRWRNCRRRQRVDLSCRGL